MTKNRTLCRRLNSTAFAGLVIITMMACGSPTGSATLDQVRARGTLICGISMGIPGFSQRFGSDWKGFDVDFCRALAAAIFNDPGKVEFVPTNASERFDALRAGRVDLLSRNTTWTMSRDSALGFSFAAITYFDGQGVMVRASTGVRKLIDLKGSTICVQSGTTSEHNLADYFASHGIPHAVVAHLTFEDALRSYSDNRCDALTADVSALHAQRSVLVPAEAHIVLDQTISKEPLGPAVRQGDAQWFNIVKWTHFVMLTAEELGVTSGNVLDQISEAAPDVRRLLGREGNLGTGLGLSDDWSVRIIKAVGNYGQVFERNLGTRSNLRLPRERNALWSVGGLQYAPPVR